jgi:hypothetical protein
VPKLVPTDPALLADMLEHHILDKRHTVLAKYHKMESEHTSDWFRLSSNREVDERGSRASVSVLGLQQLTDATSSSLSEMAAIAHKYYSSLYSKPAPCAICRDAQAALL